MFIANERTGSWGASYREPPENHVCGQKRGGGAKATTQTHALGMVVTLQTEEGYTSLFWANHLQILQG